MQTNTFSRASKFARVIACTALAVACTGAIGATNVAYTPLAGGFTGDGGQAKAANLHGVNDVAMDAAGNLYVAQTWTNQIRRIAPDGTITTIAGGRQYGYAGDGGPASKALINQPKVLTLDSLGNLYFADGNERIRKIATNGIITTIAGSGSNSPDAPTGPALEASFQEITGLAVDKAGNVYVTDAFLRRVRKITVATGTITTIAGNGGSPLGFPDEYDNVRATNVGLAWPFGVDVDANGNVWFGTVSGDLLRVGTNGYMVRRALVPNGIWDIKLNATGGTVVVGGDCYIAKVSAGTGNYTKMSGPECAGSPDGTPASTANMMGMQGITLDAAGNIYAAEGEQQRVIRISASNPTLTTYAGGRRTVANGQLGATSVMTFLNALAVDDKHNVYLADWAYAYRLRKFTNGRVFQFAGNGEAYADCWGECTDATQAAFPRPTGMAISPEGAVYVADRTLGGVFRIQPTGAMSLVGADVDPRGIATDGQGNLYIADSRGNQIHKVDLAGVDHVIAGTGDPFTGTGDDTEATGAAVYEPGALASDAIGNVYYYEPTGAVRKVGVDGIIRRFAGVYSPTPTGDETLALNHRFSGVVGSLAVHSSGVWLLDGGIVKRVRPNGRIETVPGLAFEATALAIKHNTLYVTSRAGRLLSAPLPHIVPNDFNGDGRSDLFWRGNTGVNAIWLSADAATKMSAATLATENKLVAQGDFDGDGKADLLWRNTLNGNNIVWRGGNANTQMILTALPDQGWTVAGAGDFNGDGKSDVVWRHATTGSNAIWLGGNSATRQSISSLPDTRWVIAGIGDFDADGRDDVLWRNTQGGSNTIWSSGNASVRKPIAAVTNLAWKVAAIGDFNGDSVSDIAWRDTATGANVIWKSGNHATQMPLTGVTNLQWTIAAAGDFDNDGVDDLVWRNPVSGTNTLWLNTVAGNQRAVASMGGSWKIQPVEALP